MFVVNSRLGLFSAAVNSSGGKHLHHQRPSFSRSYGCILPSSLTRVFPRTLGFSPRLPVSVFGTGDVSLPRSFSRQCRINHFVTIASNSSSHLSFRATDLPITQPTCLNTHFQSRADLPYCVTPSIKRFTPVQEFQPVVHPPTLSAFGLGPDLP